MRPEISETDAIGGGLQEVAADKIESKRLDIPGKVFGIVNGVPLTTSQMKELLTRASIIYEDLTHLSSEPILDKEKIKSLNEEIDTIFKQLEREKYRGVESWDTCSQESWAGSVFNYAETPTTTNFFEFGDKRYDLIGYNDDGLIFTCGDVRLFLGFDIEFDVKSGFHYPDKNHKPQDSFNTLMEDISTGTLFGKLERIEIGEGELIDSTLGETNVDGIYHTKLESDKKQDGSTISTSVECIKVCSHIDMGYPILGVVGHEHEYYKTYTFPDPLRDDDSWKEYDRLSSGANNHFDKSSYTDDLRKPIDDLRQELNSLRKNRA